MHDTVEHPHLSGVDDALTEGDVTNSAFLRELARAAPQGTSLWVTNFVGNPSAGSDWSGQPYTPGLDVDAWGAYNTYFSVSAVAPDDNGVVNRRANQFARLLALVVDDPHADVGNASWVFETSPGNTQVGIFLDAQDPDCADRALVTALVTRMAAGLSGDLSGNNPVRYVRLPCGRNMKSRPTGHFNVAVRLWAPRVRYSLVDAAQEFGVDLDALKQALRVTPQTSGTRAGLEQAEKVGVLLDNIAGGQDLHDSINELAASLVASGLHGGATTNLVRAIVGRAPIPRDDRWRDRYDDIPRAVRTAVQKFARTPVRSVQAADAGAPLPLPPELLPVEPFPVGALPDAFRPWVSDVAERMHCPPDFVAVPLLVAAASLVARHIGIRPQQRTDWIERCNLWALIVGRPGIMKSPAMSQALAPMGRLETRAAEAFNALAAERRAEVMATKLRGEESVKIARAKLKKDRAADVTALLTAVDERDEPIRRRYVVNDLTYEKLGEILATNPDGVLSVRDEMRGLLVSLAREESAPARAFYSKLDAVRPMTA